MLVGCICVKFISICLKQSFEACKFISICMKQSFEACKITLICMKQSFEACKITLICMKQSFEACMFTTICMKQSFEACMSLKEFHPVNIFLTYLSKPLLSQVFVGCYIFCLLFLHCQLSSAAYLESVTASNGNLLGDLGDNCLWNTATLSATCCGMSETYRAMHSYQRLKIIYLVKLRKLVC